MKNILFVISSLKSWWWAEKVCSTIWSKLQEKWYNIHFLTFYDSENLYDFKWKYFSLDESISSNIIVNIYKLFKRAYNIKKYCKQNNIENSISFMEEANFSNIISKVLFKNNSKIFVSIRQSVDAWWKLYKFLIKKLYNFSDKIITIVKEEKENLIKNYNIKKEKIEVIYNPIDIEKINNLKKEDLWEDKELFENNKFTFINIWRLSYPKNQELLIKVFKKFNEKYDNTQLIILWDWELRSDLEKKIWDNKNIHLLWKKQNPYKYLYNSDVFLFTSRYEWMPWVLLESLACWLPIISTDCITGPKEILKKEVKSFEEVKDISLEEYGILTPVYNEQKVFEAIEKIYLEKNLREKYQKKSLEKSKDFNIESIINEWESIL